MRVGAAREEITPAESLGRTLMGWGDTRHRASQISTPLYARALVIESPEGHRVHLASLDICFITEELRRRILERLKIEEDDLVLSATHTHSAPGGHCTYVVYAVTVNGLDEEVLSSYVEGTVRAIQNAIQRLEMGTLRWSAGEFPLNEPVAFNRALRAWNLNRDTPKYRWSKRNRAVDREMTLLRVDRADGTAIAVWNWFSVHATLIHRDQHRVHSDHKGVAASQLETRLEALGHRGVVAVFAQGAAGDVTPNFRRYPGLPDSRGAFRDDEKSCQFHAELQCNRALTLFHLAGTRPAQPLVLKARLEYHDFSGIEIAPDLLPPGHEAPERTASSEVGVMQLYGTSEGRGAPWAVILLLRFMIRVCQLYNFLLDRALGKPTRWPWTRDPSHGGKLTLIGAGRSEFLETTRIRHLIVPDFAHPTMETLKRWGKRNVLKERPFTPQILPLQLIRIGNLVLAAVPAEFTTTSGKRLRALLEQELSAQRVERVIIHGYANGYSSYVTTPEEYEHQGYEGACTLFGQWTLLAYLTRFRELARRLASGAPRSPGKPPSPPSPAYWEAIRRP